MWQYNYDYLCHSGDYLMHRQYKYIDKYEKNGKTVYVYETPMQAAGRRAEYNINHPISSAISGTKLWYPAQKNELRKTSPLSSTRSVGGVFGRNARKSQNIRQNEINKSVDAASKYVKSQAASNAQNARQNEINKSMKLSVSRAQDSRQKAIDKSITRANDVAVSKAERAYNKAKERALEAANNLYQLKRFSYQPKEQEISAAASDVHKYKTEMEKAAQDLKKAKEKSRVFSEYPYSRDVDNDLNKTLNTIGYSTYISGQSLNGSTASRSNAAQNAREAAIADSVKATDTANKIADAKRQTKVNKAVAKTIEYINKTQGTNYGSEAGTAAEKERVKKASEESRERAAKDQNSRKAAIARSVEATKNATPLVNANKQETERRRSSNTAERSQNAREAAIAKSINTSRQISNAKKQEYERMITGSTRTENAERDADYITDLLNKEKKSLKDAGNIGSDLYTELSAYQKVYNKVKNDSKVTPVTKEKLQWIIKDLEKDIDKAYENAETFENSKSIKRWK